MTLIKSSKLALMVLLPLLGAATLNSCTMKQQQETVGQYVDGGVLTAQVKAKILADKKLRNTSISVKTYKNTVQLSGYVHTEKQKMDAEAIARSIDGVDGVENVIAVKK